MDNFVVHNTTPAMRSTHREIARSFLQALFLAHKNFEKSFILIISGLFFLTTGCQDSGLKYPAQLDDNLAFLDSLNAKIKQISSSNPDSALAFSDLALDYVSKENLPDSLYLKFLWQKSFFLRSLGKQEESFNNLNVARVKAIASEDPRLIALSANALGDHHLHVYQPELAENYYTQALNYFKSNNEDELVPQILSSLARLSVIQSDNYKAQEYIEKTLPFFEAAKDTLNLIMSYSDLGYNMAQLKFNEKALEYTRKGIKLLPRNENGEFKASNSEILTNLALNYRHIYPDSCIYYYKIALGLTSQTGDSLSSIITTFNFANVLNEAKRYPEALEKYNIVLDYCRRNQITQGIPLALNGLGSLYINNGEFEKSNKYFTEAHALLMSSGNIGIAMQNAEAWIEGLAQTGRLEKMLSVQTLMDSLTNIRENQNFAKTVNYIHESDSLKKMVFQQQALLRDQETTTQKLSLQKILLTISLILLITTAVLTFLWVTLNKSKTRATTLLLDKYKTEVLSKDHDTKAESSRNLAQELQKKFQEEKLYLQPNLKTEDVLNELNINYQELNQVLKNNFNTNFYGFVNKFRIQAAIEIMGTTEFQDRNLDEIPSMVGFNNRQSFYKVFQRETGVTPGKFKEFILG